MKVSEKCDVYSFGVVTLEVLIGRHPGDLISSLLLSSFASSAHDVLLEDVLDERLAHRTNQELEKEVEFLLSFFYFFTFAIRKFSKCGKPGIFTLALNGSKHFLFQLEAWDVLSSNYQLALIKNRLQPNVWGAALAGEISPRRLE
nr:isoform 2 of probable leucine-rich repeat receptor-like protein kinase [Quercus suber]